VHQRQPVAVFGFVEVVRGDEHGHALRRQPIDQLPELAARYGIHAPVGSSRNRIDGS